MYVLIDTKLRAFDTHLRGVLQELGTPPIASGLSIDYLRDMDARLAYYTSFNFAYLCRSCGMCSYVQRSIDNV